MDVKAWILSTGTVVILSVLGFLGKDITAILKDIRQDIRNLLVATTTHQNKIERLEEASRDHENRLRSLEGIPEEKL